MAHTALASLRTYADLTKPRLLPMVLFTGLPVFGMAAGGWTSIGFATLTLFGIALAAASANTLNVAPKNYRRRAASAGSTRD